MDDMDKAFLCCLVGIILIVFAQAFATVIVGLGRVVRVP